MFHTERYERLSLFLIVIGFIFAGFSYFSIIFFFYLAYIDDFWENVEDDDNDYWDEWDDDESEEEEIEIFDIDEAPVLHILTQDLPSYDHDPILFDINLDINSIESLIYKYDKKLDY